MIYTLTDVHGNPVEQGPFSIDSETGVLSFADTPRAGAGGPEQYTIYVKATAPDGSSAIQSFDVTVSGFGTAAEYSGKYEAAYASEGAAVTEQIAASTNEIDMRGVMYGSAPRDVPGDAANAAGNEVLQGMKLAAAGLYPSSLDSDGLNLNESDTQPGTVNEYSAGEPSPGAAAAWTGDLLHDDPYDDLSIGSFGNFGMNWVQAIEGSQPLADESDIAALGDDADASTHIDGGVWNGFTEGDLVEW